MKEVRRIQKEILKGYERDFSKHSPKEQIERIKMVWKSIPSQLFKDNKKFIYGALRQGARAKDFEIAIEWLVDSGLLIRFQDALSQLCLWIYMRIFLYLNFIFWI